MHQYFFQKYLHLPEETEIAEVCFYGDEELKRRKYYFAFTAERSVIDLLLKKHPFQKAEGNRDADFAFARHFRWWNAEIRAKSEYYVWREYQGEYLRTHYQVWYHPERKKCQISLHYFYVPQKGLLKYYRFMKYDANR